MYQVSKDVTYLYGTLTHSGVTDNIINSLAISLQKVELAGEKSIRIDCGKISSADISGLQLLYVWMQCARFRGVEPKLVNLSAGLLLSIKSAGLGHYFTEFKALSAEA